MIVRIVIPFAPFKILGGYLNTITREWGGYTQTSGSGAYLLDHRGDVTTEPITILDVHVGDDTPPCRQWWRGFASRIQFDLNQESVYLQFSAADVEFVDGLPPSE